MKAKALHEWDVTPAEARRIQQELRGRVVLHDELPEVHHVAGVDVGFEDKGRVARAAVAVLSFPELAPVDQAVARRPVSFPYVPGLLSFREIPVITDALQQISVVPELILCDGQGYAHPRRMGIACHLGLVMDCPTIGVAKSRLVGSHAGLARRKGSRVQLMHGGEVIGVVLRTRDGVRPLYVSAGHRVGLATAVEYTLRCVRRYRLPETTRAAHRLASG